MHTLAPTPILTLFPASQLHGYFTPNCILELSYFLFFNKSNPTTSVPLATMFRKQIHTFFFCSFVSAISLLVGGKRGPVCFDSSGQRLVYCGPLKEKKTHTLPYSKHKLTHVYMHTHRDTDNKQNGTVLCAVSRDQKGHPSV